MANFNPSNPSAAPVEPPEAIRKGAGVKIFKTAFIFGFVVLLLSPVGALAHPMGNFSINHYSRLMLNGQDIRIEYILDFAEIPTFQMFPEFRGGGAGPRPRALAPEGVHQLELRIDDLVLPVSLVDSIIETKPGAGNLSTVRATLRLAARWTGKSGTLRFVDRNFPGRIGWKEIVLQAMPPLGFPSGNPFSDDLSAGLSRYPSDLLTRAPNVVEAAIRVGADSALSHQAPVQLPEAAVTTASRDTLSQILGENGLPLRTVVVGLLVAFSLGALHALSPGHGKTVVASF